MIQLIPHLGIYLKEIIKGAKKIYVQKTFYGQVFNSTKSGKKLNIQQNGSFTSGDSL